MALPPSRRFAILIVCTGNICRSPTAQLLLSHRLRQLLGVTAEAIELTSAGTHGMVGQPIEPAAAAVLEELGVTPATFAARQLDPSFVEDADLILCATREHRAAIARLVPRVTPRTFTLCEFARLVAAVDPNHISGDEFVERIRILVEKAAQLRGVVRAQTPGDDDVDDPYRRQSEAFARAGKQVSEAVDVIAAAFAAAGP